MEHWLTEKATIYALMLASDVKVPFSDSEVEAAFRIRKKEKALKLLQLVYLSTLERAMFMNQLRTQDGTVRLTDYYVELARKLVPHDVPSKQNIFPLMNAFQANSDVRAVSLYRYLWGDCMSAVLYEKVKEQYSQATNVTSDNEDKTSKIDTFRQKLRMTLLGQRGMVNIDTLLDNFNIDSKEVTSDALFELYGLRKWDVVRPLKDEDIIS